MSKKKIAILLPFKDHFTNSKAGSASIWVKDFNKKSKYKDQIYILWPALESNKIPVDNGSFAKVPNLPIRSQK